MGVHAKAGAGQFIEFDVAVRKHLGVLYSGGLDRQHPFRWAQSEKDELF